MKALTALRLAAVMAVLLLAALGLLLVTGAIDRAQFQEFSIQVLLVTAILAAAALVIGLLLKDHKN